MNTDLLSLFGEDTVAYPISATFNFTDPTGASGAPVGGNTFGFIAPFTSCGIIAGGCGRVNWGSPSIFNFGDGGQFSLSLFNATFATPGTATVRGRFTLIADATPAVPEPATWAMLIVGFFGIGGVLRSPGSKQHLAVSYA